MEEESDSLLNSATIVNQLDLVLAELEKNSIESSNNSIDVTTQFNLILDVIEDVSFFFLSSTILSHIVFFRPNRQDNFPCDH